MDTQGYVEPHTGVLVHVGVCFGREVCSGVCRGIQAGVRNCQVYAIHRNKRELDKVEKVMR